MTDSLIAISGLSVNIGELWIVEDWSFNINKGDLVLITGNNGTGKSTILKTICGLRKPTFGTVYQHKGVKCCYMPQHFCVPSHMAITVRMFLLLLSKELPVLLLKKLNVYHLLDRSMHNLSGGELQKVLFCMTITQRCDVTMMDEPESHLDQESVNCIVEEISTQAKNGKSFVVISHERMKLADRSAHILDINQTICCKKHDSCI